MKRTFVISSIAVVSFALLMMLEVWRPSAYQHLHDLSCDVLARNGRTTAPNPNLVFLAIDSDSVSLDEGADVEELYGLTEANSNDARALRLMSQQWPWPREVYGLILERLAEAGAKAVLFDLTFPTATDGDEPFRLALDRYKDRVVIGSNFVSATSRGFASSAPSHTRPPESLVPQTLPMDDRAGYTNFWPDDDDVVRRVRFRLTFEELLNTAPRPDAEIFVSLAGRGLMKAGWGKAIPDGLSDHLFRFTGLPRAGFPSRSIFEIFVPEYWKRNYRNGTFFRDKIVLVGAEGNWQHDEHPTPFGAMPGPEIHLNAINAALQGEFLHEWPLLGIGLLTLATGALAISLSRFIGAPWLRVLVLALANAAGAWIALLLYNRASLYLPIVAPGLELDATVLLGLVSDFTWERLEKTRVKRALEKYVSSNVVRELLGNPKAFQQSLGGVVKPAAILFSDIRGYSTVAARTDPQALVGQLNEYLGAMVECVFRFGGTLDKFIGDAVMAVWGNVQTQGVRNDAANAVRAALAMRDELVRLNRSWKQRGLPELRIGIAVNHGDVVVGNIGSPQRMEFTVIGDAVNISWKLQELTKDLGCDLAVTQNMAPLLVEDFELRPLGGTLLDGQSETMEIFAVVGPVDLAEKALSAAVAARL